MNSNFQEFAEIAKISMGRTLFMAAFADHREDPDSLGEGKPCPGHSCANGEDWADFTPTTHPDAFKAGEQLAQSIEKLNHKRLAQLLEDAAFADDGCHFSEEDDAIAYAQEFGHYLAMQSLGHGVSWFDDHAEFPLELPLVSSHVWQCEACGDSVQFE